jgi:hypothetical protein
LLPPPPPPPPPPQSLPAGKEGDRLLLLWGVEDAVKRRYQQYVTLLERCRCVKILMKCAMVWGSRGAALLG